MNRRDFLLRTGAVTASALLPGSARLLAREAGTVESTIPVIIDPNDAVAQSVPVRRAIEELDRAARVRGLELKTVSALGETLPGQRCLALGSARAALGTPANVSVEPSPESLTLAQSEVGGRKVQFILGSDVRGLVYAITEIADGLDHGEALFRAEASREKPANRVRSVMRLFSSDVEDMTWFNDRGFWQRYFRFLVSQRYNRFNLALGLGYDQPVGLTDTYFYFAYPFLVTIPGYDVRATGVSPAERDRNLEMLRFISDEAVACGLEFQLGVWTHACTWTNSPKANHVIEGLDARTQAPYCRDALAQLLRECPNISGVTLRIHGESGVPEGSYDFWGTVFSGAKLSGREVRLDLHAKGLDQPTLDAALGTQLPLTISPKFWAEHLGLPYHQAAIRPTEMPTGHAVRGPFAQSEGSRSFLRYGYGDLLRDDRKYQIVHRVWPGTQRMLLWADPVFGAAYSRAMTFAGSDGCEWFEPLSFKGRKGSGLPLGRDGYADRSLRAPGDDFEKYRLTHRIWGRTLYRPETAQIVFERQLRDEAGPAAREVGTALGCAGRILPLFTTAHGPSAANNHFWPEMYVNMAMADPTAPVMPYPDTLEPRRFTHVSPFDPQLFAHIEEQVDADLAGRALAKYSPLEVATWLGEFADRATRALLDANKKTGGAPLASFRRLTTDAEILLRLGWFFERKLRAGVLFSLYQKTAYVQARDAAVGAYRQAREAWVEIVAITKPAYASDVSYGEAWYQRGHWSDRLPAIDRDIAAVGAASPFAPATVVPVDTLERLVANAMKRGGMAAATVTVSHVAPGSFTVGQRLPLRFEISGPVESVAIHYRVVNQAETWRQGAATKRDDAFHFEIPATETSGIYPLQYYAAIQTSGGEPVQLYPGLGRALTQTPYLIVRPSSAL